MNSSLPLPRLASHNLAAPTADDFRDAIRAVAPADYEQVWTQACAVSEIRASAFLLDLPELERLAAALSEMPAPVSLAGRALVIRVASYRGLSGVEPKAETSARDWGRASLEQLLRKRFPEAERMAEIADLNLFTKESRARLDKAAKEVAERFGAEIGLVSIVLEGAQEFAGSHGLSGWSQDAAGTPVEWSFCATMVRTREPYVVPDAHNDVLQRSNPLVENDHLVSYAGVPLITSRNQVVGSLCVLGVQARQYSQADLADLQTLADAVVAEAESHRLTKD